ncbi:MAG: MFS transporter [Actinobacteria bacterium]|nr:MFS transporter [Actinomycetota bacterium]
MLSGGMAAATIFSFAMGVLAPVLVEEVGLSRVQVGMVVAIYFLVGTVLSPGSGSAVDVFGGWRLLFALFVASAGAMVMLSLAPGVAVMILAAVIAGVALGISNPVTNKVLVQGIEPRHRGWVMGIKQTGSYVGAMVSGSLLPLLLTVMGWRAASMLLAVPMLGLAVPAYRRMGRRENSPSPRSSIRWGLRMDGQAYLKWLLIYGVFIGLAMAAVYTYLPLYAVEALQLSLQVSGFAMTVVGGAGITARLLVGWLTPRITSAPALMGAVGLAPVAAVSLLFWHGPLSATAALMVAAVMFGVSGGAWSVLANIVLLQRANIEQTGTASGIVQVGFTVGLFANAVGFGAFADLTGSYEVGWGTVALAFLVAGIVGFGWHFQEGMAITTD